MDQESRGRNKYSLIKNRRLDEIAKENGGLLPEAVSDAIETLKSFGALDVGDSPQTEFFVMRLKDRFAAPALHMYAQHAAAVDVEYADGVAKLSKRAGMSHPHCKNPD